MDFEEFRLFANDYNTVPVYEKITADLFTPVSVYLNLRSSGSNTFLLESVEGIGRFARYSFIGFDPDAIIQNRSRKLFISNNVEVKSSSQNIFDYLQQKITSANSPKITELPDFTGGIVGFLGYENIMLIEDSLKYELKDDLDISDSIFGVYKTIIVFDHYKHQVIIISNVVIEKDQNLKTEFDKAKNKIKSIKKQLFKPMVINSGFKFLESKENSFEPEDFYKSVEKAKRNIYDGDIFQIVLSKRFGGTYEGDILNLYRALRIINPSPYMYLMEFEGDIKIIGTSPEDLLKVKDKRATVLPIAGTRRRGIDEDDDLRLENELLNDPKELAEHVMLVDLARNDLGRVSEFDSVQVKEDKVIHKFSHVMHIVSRVEGKLKVDKDSIDALKACFPAGTVSGAPKIRAMELIAEYEKLKRNVYAGAVGYIDFKGNLDVCIAIRTFFAVKNKLYWQAGAGIVADSQPELELKEIYNKSAVLLTAIRKAEVINENIDD